MIDAQAIAAATATLRQLLLDGLPKQDAVLAQVDVTSLPPDKVNANVDRATLNVFLYRVALPSQWRNSAPGRVAPMGEASSQFGLTLRYLLTAYGRVDQAAGDLGHRVLGAAMRVLDDATVIPEGELNTMSPLHPELTASQAMRVVPVDTTMEEMASLWSMFQSSYRLSVVYEIQLLAARGKVGAEAVLNDTAIRSWERFSSNVQALGLGPEASGVMQRVVSELDAAESVTNLCVLFVGSSGQSAQRAAQLLASECGRPLHRVEPSTYSSRYIGETEKNLSRSFDEAKATGAILFFDEADALFGKRTEVRDSHERYASTDIDALLQRLDAYPGLVVVATAGKTSLDPEFQRRFRFIVDFPPAEKE